MTQLGILEQRRLEANILKHVRDALRQSRARTSA